MDRTAELKSRIEARRKQLEADLARAKADAQGRLNDTGEAIEKKLASLTEALAGGWEKLSDATVDRLNEWLKG